jgi:hypothetical protein
MLRLALLITNNRSLSRLQIHSSTCPDVMKLFRRGAFVQILSAFSPESLKLTELLSSFKSVQDANDCMIMPCCRQVEVAA